MRVQLASVGMTEVVKRIALPNLDDHTRVVYSVSVNRVGLAARQLFEQQCQGHLIRVCALMTKRPVRARKCEGVPKKEQQAKLPVTAARTDTMSAVISIGVARGDAFGPDR